MRDSVRDPVRAVIEATLTKLKESGALTLAAMPKFAVEAPKKAAHGDYAVNVAMMLAKPEKKNPRAIAEMIKDALADDTGVVSAVEIAGPGFINIRLHPAHIQATVGRILGSAETYGQSVPAEKQRVNVEFVSANPTGPLHLGHARGTFMGDALARLLTAAGHDVVREYYTNDFGKQMETLGRTVHARYRELFGETITLEEGQYPAAYVIDIAQTLKDEDGDKWLGKPESEWLDRCVAVGIRENLKTIRQTLEQCGVQHDVWTSEAGLHQRGAPLAVVEAYRERGELYEAEQARGTDDKVRRDGSKAAQFTGKQLGGTFLQTSKYGDEEDRIILRHDGTPVYLTADLAYHKDKIDRGFDRVIDVWGADHAGHVPRIRGGMEALGYDKKRVEFVLVQIVRLMREGEEVRISKRSGEIYELSELVDEVGQDAVRFIFLMRAANTQFDFDIELAKTQNNDNPVFYCQMGHARCVNLLKKAEERGVPFLGHEKLDAETLSALKLPEELAMLKKMASFPAVVAGAADALEPHRVLFFAQDLISDFHSYFSKYKHDERIVSDDVNKTQARLGMVSALRVTLRAALGLLGITAPDWMAPEPRADDATQTETESTERTSK